MDWLMYALGFIFSVAFIYVGVKFAFFPQNAVRYLQRVKYKESGSVGKRERIFSIIMGAIFMIVGIYYMIILIASLVTTTAS